MSGKSEFILTYVDAEHRGSQRVVCGALVFKEATSKKLRTLRTNELNYLQSSAQKLSKYLPTAENDG